MVQLSSNEIQYGPAPAAIPMGGRARSATRQGGKETRPMRHRNVVAVAVVVAVTAVAAAAAPPTPRARHTPTPRRPTGYDIAVVNIRTTGPNGSVANAILPTFKNVGTKTINRTLSFTYWVNGKLVNSPSIALSLAPGQAFVRQPYPIEAGLVKYGDTVEVFIDSSNNLHEDNESNNRMTKVLAFPVVMPGGKLGPTGYDIAVVNIRTTGPNGSVANAILPTFKNLGTKTIDRTLQFYYWVNGWGGDPYSASIAFSLAPGQTFVYQPNPLEAGFVKYGDTVRVFIDPKNKLAEDNESNNSMTKLLVAPAVMPRH
jgi:hypothetical protein